MKTVNFLHITPAATAHFAQLLAQEGVPGTQIRIATIAPGTPSAEVAITFCPPGHEQVADCVQSCNSFCFFIDAAAEPFLQDAEIHYQVDDLGGGELVIRAPHLKKTTLSLTDQISYVIETEINPGLASHGGQVALVAFEANEGIAVLQFSGGCQGCGMANVTLKQGIEKTLTSRLPFVQSVRDVTDHDRGENPYYA